MDHLIWYFSIEEASGEVAFENNIIETIVKEAETDHILDNDQKNRKLIVEDLIEQKKVYFHHLFII